MAYNQEKTIEFREIVLSHLKKILEISTTEFKRNAITKTNSITKNTSQSIEDNRKSFCQAVESFCAVLIPYFDSKMQSSYDEHIKILELYPHEYYKENHEKVRKILKDLDMTNIKSFYDQCETFLIREQLKSSKILFRELNMLLNRNDYLKSSVYSEEKDEVVVGDEDEEEKE